MARQEPQARSYFNPTVPDVAIKSLFMKYDKDNSKTLEKGEVETMLKEDYGMTPDQVKLY